MDGFRRQLLGVGVVLGVVTVVALVVSPAAVLAAFRTSADRPALFLGLLVLAYLLRPLAAWPMTPLSVAVGFGFGYAGLPLALALTLVTCLPGYALGRRSPERGPLGRAGALSARYFETTGPARGVAGARLVPLPADAVSYAAGVAGLGLRPYLLGTLAGELPWVLAAVALGRSLETLTVTGITDALPLVIGLTALAVLVLGGPLYRELRARRG